MAQDWYMSPNGCVLKGLIKIGFSKSVAKPFVWKCKHDRKVYEMKGSFVRENKNGQLVERYVGGVDVFIKFCGPSSSTWSSQKRRIWQYYGDKKRNINGGVTVETKMCDGTIKHTEEVWANGTLISVKDIHIPPVIAAVIASPTNIMSEDDIAATQQTAPEDDIVATQQTAPEDDIAATQQTAPEDDIAATQQTVPEDDIAATQQTAPEDDIAATQQTAPEDDIAAKQQTAPEDDIAATQQTVPEDDVAATQQTAPEDDIAAEDSAVNETILWNMNVFGDSISGSIRFIDPISRTHRKYKWISHPTPTGTHMMSGCLFDGKPISHTIVETASPCGTLITRTCEFSSDMDALHGTCFTVETNHDGEKVRFKELWLRGTCSKRTPVQRFTAGKCPRPATSVDIDDEDGSSSDSSDDSSDEEDNRPNPKHVSQKVPRSRVSQKVPRSRVSQKVPRRPRVGNKTRPYAQKQPRLVAELYGVTFDQSAEEHEVEEITVPPHNDNDDIDADLEDISDDEDDEEKTEVSSDEEEKKDAERAALAKRLKGTWPHLIRARRQFKPGNARAGPGAVEADQVTLANTVVAFYDAFRAEGGGFAVKVKWASGTQTLEHLRNVAHCDVAFDGFWR
jgi:hypothetical protein